MESRRRRVPALAPEERRAALIAATIPLLHEHGLEVSTKQIAHAAGVAEGTIFGVTKSNACAEPGDSGGSWITGNQAQGTESGGSGNCTTGGTQYFQPVSYHLAAYGLQLILS